jgi:arylformamidase
MRPRLDDPAWLDAQYNNRARVPDAMDVLARWAQASRVAREGSPARRLDLRYGDGPGETLDVFPAARPGAPVLVFVHGGYWRALDKSDHSFVAPSFVAGGRHGGGAQLRAVPGGHASSTSPCRWCGRGLDLAPCGRVRRRPRSHRRWPATRQGGHLAAMLLSCRWKQVADDLPARLVQGALSISGLYDLEPVRLTPFLQTDLRLTPARCGASARPSSRAPRAASSMRWWVATKATSSCGRTS